MQQSTNCDPSPQLFFLSSGDFFPLLDMKKAAINMYGCIIIVLLYIGILFYCKLPQHVSIPVLSVLVYCNSMDFVPYLSLLRVNTMLRNTRPDNRSAIHVPF